MSEKINIGVLDDERVAVDGLVKLLQKQLDQAEVRGFQYHQQFLAWVEEVRPELVFLDMEMPSSSGLKIAQQIKEKVGSIVFVTAHSHYSLEAFDTAVDYILKPVAPSRIKQCLHKLGRLQPVTVFEDRYVRLPIRGSFSSIKEVEILMLRGQRNYTEVVLANGESHLVARTLKNFSEVLSDRFWRVHKSLIIRSDAIKEIHWGVKPHIELEGNHMVEASKTRLHELGLKA